MAASVVDMLQAFFQDQRPKTIAEFIEEHGREQVQAFLGGCWAALDLADILGGMVADGTLAEEGADVMWTELEADLEKGMVALGLKRTTPIC